jgi:hypothetical protein
VNTHDILQLGFFLGVGYAAFRQIRKDVNGIGSNQRSAEGKAERRWKHAIATAIETSATLDEAKMHAKLLKEDAWSDKR